MQTTINPALDSLTPEERDSSLKILERECGNILEEVDRLDRQRDLQERRLRNVIHLVCGSYYLYIFMQVTKGNLGFQHREYFR